MFYLYLLGIPRASATMSNGNHLSSDSSSDGSASDSDDGDKPFYSINKVGFFYNSTKVYLMVSNSLTLECWKVKKVEAGVSLEQVLSHFSLFKAKISILVPSNHGFQANLQNFIYFPVNIVGIIAIYERE